MIGGAAESIILDLRDFVRQKLAKAKLPEPKNLGDRRANTILDVLYDFLDTKKGSFPKDLREEIEAYWLPFPQHNPPTRHKPRHSPTRYPIHQQDLRLPFLVFPHLAPPS